MEKYRTDDSLMGNVCGAQRTNTRFCRICVWDFQQYHTWFHLYLCVIHGNMEKVSNLYACVILEKKKTVHIWSPCVIGIPITHSYEMDTLAILEKPHIFLHFFNYVCDNVPITNTSID